MNISASSKRRMNIAAVIITIGVGLLTVFSVAGTVINLPVALTIFFSGLAAGVTLKSVIQNLKK